MGKIDNFSMLNTVPTELSDKQLAIPLRLRLIIKNVESIKKLLEEYGVSPQEIFNF